MAKKAAKDSVPKRNHQSCDFGMKEFNKTKRSKEFVKEIREKEKKQREKKVKNYECPEGYEFDLDLNECVPIISPTGTTSDHEKPSVPQNLRVTSIEDTAISLAWDASTDNVEVKSYKIFFKKEGAPTYAVTTRGLVANFKGFTPDTNYTFYVRSCDTSDNLSSPSSNVGARTLPTTTTTSSTSTTTTFVPSTTSSTTQAPTTTTTTTSSTADYAIVYFDFNGGVVSGTAWNSSGTIVYDTSGLTMAEEDTVIAGVTQDYIDYKVLITTDKNVFNAADPRKRTWVIVTESWEWYCGSTPCAGGVAYIGSMFWGNNTPCWVFSSALSYSSRYVRDAATHEVGHTIGLYHQSVYDANCVKTAEYNPGNNVCDCAPNMGVTYSRTYGQWWVGPNSRGCNVIQDDRRVISSAVGTK